MTASPSARPVPRVTLRQIARQAGVSAQTVSMALRRHPNIPPSTRWRIQAIAERAGYRPDPHLAKLMHHLRGSRRSLGVANVCALTTRPSGVHEAFCDALLVGAREEAERTGFNLAVMHVGQGEELPGPRLQRVLRSRGVEGVLLLPMAGLCALDDLLDWRDFAVVSATLSVASPRFDRVAVDHFKNVFTLCERLRAAGFRRPGLVIHPEHDARCGHLISAAHAWHGVYGDHCFVPAHVCPRLDSRGLRRWLIRERPDVVLAEHDGLALELRAERTLLGGPPIVSCSARPCRNGDFPFPGIHDQPAQIGAAALEIIARMVTSGQRGIPEHPRTTLVPGAWVGTMPFRSAVASRPP